VGHKNTLRADHHRSLAAIHDSSSRRGVPGQGSQMVEEDYVYKSETVQNLNTMLLRRGKQLGRRLPEQGEEESSYCLCQRIHHPNGGNSFIGCDLCENWFHAECVNLSEKAFKKLKNNPNSQFFCDFCKAYRAINSKVDSNPSRC